LYDWIRRQPPNVDEGAGGGGEALGESDASSVDDDGFNLRFFVNAIEPLAVDSLDSFVSCAKRVC